MNRAKEMIQLFLHDMPRSIWYVLLITLCTWFFYLFKQVEPAVYPVVSDFNITDVRLVDGHKEIAGYLVKDRDCEFKGLTGYSESGALVVIDFGREEAATASRIAIEGKQAWGWWVIMPPVDYLILYSRHSCSTGTVVTKIYEGEV